MQTLANRHGKLQWKHYGFAERDTVCPRERPSYGTWLTFHIFSFHFFSFPFFAISTVSLLLTSILADIVSFGKGNEESNWPWWRWHVHTRG